MWETGILHNDRIRLLGRRNPDKEAFEAHWTGSGIELRVRCARLEIELEAMQPSPLLWALVTVDGAPVARFAVETGRRWYTAVYLSACEEHTVRILRETQPMADANELHLRMHAVRADGELLDLKPTSMTLECVGDSLTSGEGLAGAQSEMEWLTAWMSSQTWAQRTADALNARVRSVSQSGWGVYSSWDGRLDCVLPAVYDAVCAVGGVDEAPYDFALEPADAVIINLGTNDGNALRNVEDKAAFHREIGRAAEAFIRHVRSLNPQAYILWAYGMCGHDIAPTLRAAVERVRRSGDLRVGYVSLPACREGEQGSRMHPGERCHQAAAEAIVRALEAIR